MLIKSTLETRPVRAIVYGKDGVGKSTFCSCAPAPVFIAVESGLANIDTMAVPSPNSWDQLLEFTIALASEPSCSTVVIDSLDWAEQLCWTHVCEEGDDKGPKKNIEQFGYGKGYVAALNEWRCLISALNRCVSAGKNVLLVAHSARKSVKNPMGDDYDSWQVKLNEKAAALLREWVDIVGFADLEMVVIGKDNGAKAVSNGRRVLRTEPSACFDSKTRFSIPAVLPLEWSALESAMCKGKPKTIPELKDLLESKLKSLGLTDVTAKCMKYVKDNGGTRYSLTKSIETVDSYLEKKQ